MPKSRPRIWSANWRCANQNSNEFLQAASSDGLAGEPRPRGRGKKRRRKPGGQPGHRGAHRAAGAGRERERDPTGPDQCQHCGHRLPTQIEQVQTTGEPRRHQVTELPPIQARTIEYQCHRVVCPECGESTRAAVPEEASGHFGPQADRGRNLRPATPQHSGLPLSSDPQPSPPSISGFVAIPTAPTELLPSEISLIDQTNRSSRQACVQSPADALTNAAVTGRHR